jgi:nucleolar protein 14
MLASELLLELLLPLEDDDDELKSEETIPQLSIERDAIDRKNDTSAAILFAALHFQRSLSEKEAFTEITGSVLCLNPRSKSDPWPEVIQLKVASVALAAEDVCTFDKAHMPLQRRSQLSTREMAIKRLAPRLENPERYSLSRDKDKNATQAAADRARREYKREHKAVARELRLDGTFIENERRTDQGKRDAAAKAKRHRAYAWLEGEQASVNQQVRQGVVNYCSIEAEVNVMLEVLDEWRKSSWSHDLY